jgi:serine/threonine protein phosphatase PrpC
MLSQLRDSLSGTWESYRKTADQLPIVHYEDFIHGHRGGWLLEEGKRKGGSLAERLLKKEVLPKGERVYSEALNCLLLRANVPPPYSEIVDRDCALRDYTIYDEVIEEQLLTERSAFALREGKTTPHSELFEPYVDCREFISDNVVRGGPGMDVFPSGCGEQTLFVKEVKLPVHSQNNQAKLLALFEGVGGSQCAQFLSLNLLNTLMRQLQIQFSDGVSTIAYARAMAFTTVDLSHYFCPKLPSYDDSGAVGVFAIVMDQFLIVANCGDCRAIVIPPDGDPVQLTRAAKFTTEEYFEEGNEKGYRLEGGILNAGLSKVNVARMMGKHSLKNATQACSDVVEWRIPEGGIRGGHLVLQSRRGAEAMSPEQLARWIRIRASSGQSASRIATDLCKITSKLSADPKAEAGCHRTNSNSTLIFRFNT